MAHPDYLVCPIGLDLMRDPVVAADGRVYERANVERWIDMQTSEGQPATSPMDPSKTLGDKKGLMVAWNIRDALSAYFQQHPELGMSLLPSMPPSHIAHAAMPKRAECSPVQPSAPAMTPTMHSALAYPPAQPSVQSASFSCKIESVPGEDNLALLRISPTTPPSGDQRTPLNLSIVLDASGSMSANLQARDERNALIEFNLSVMDIAKFAAKVAASCLQPGDQINVVRFSNDATLTVRPTSVSEASLARIKADIDSIEDNGGTNLWAGVSLGLRQLKASARPGMHNVCLVLTDGEPNEHPSAGYDAAQARFKEDPEFRYVLNTMAFGYGAIDSRLLKTIAMQGGGTFVNIPDSGLIGTVFTNMLAASACTTHQQLRIHDVERCLDPFRPCSGDFLWNSDTGILELGNIHAGQDRTVLLRLGPGRRAANLKLQVEATQCQLPSTTIRVQVSGMGQAAAPVADVLRAKASDLLMELLVLMSSLKDEEAMVFLDRFLADYHVRAQNPKMFVDLSEQVRQALTTSAFKRWGHTYIPSLAMAYDHCLRHNFKDPGVQHFGGALFRRLASEMSDVYDSMPVPRGTRGTGVALTSGAQLNNRYGGCYTGDSLVAMADGTKKPCRSIQRGDVLLGGGRIELAVAIAIPEGAYEFCRVNEELSITEYHPIYYGGRWVFPRDVLPVETLACTAMYSFLLESDSNHQAVFGGCPTITLGHNIVDDPALKHDFFGTDAVRGRLTELHAKFNDSSGLVVFGPFCLLESSVTGVIVDFDESKLLPALVDGAPASNSVAAC